MSYGKIFETVFTGTLFGSGPTVFAVWAYVIATAKPPGVVELNPKLLAACIGTDISAVKDAIALLCDVDEDSRNEDHDGRRLLHLGGLQYQLVSFQKYRDMVSAEDKRAADRQRIAEKRKQTRQDATQRDMSQPVAESRKESQQVVNVAEAEAEAEEKRSTDRKRSDAAPLRVADLVGKGLPEPLARELLSHRKAKRAPLTPAAWQGFEREAGAAGWPIDMAVRETIERGWQAFRAEWVQGRAPPGDGTETAERRKLRAALDAQDEWLRTAV